MDDKVGFAATDDDGRFEIRFGPEMFREVFESRPDLYLRIYDQAGTRLLHETIRWNAEHLERFEVKFRRAPSIRFAERTSEAPIRRSEGKFAGLDS